MKRFHYKIYTGVVFILWLLLSTWVLFSMEQRDLKTAHERADQTALIQASRIQKTIEDILYTSRTMEVFLKQGNGTIDHFSEIAADVIGDYPIRNIALAPEGIITQIYPIGGNEKAVGHNLLSDPNRSFDSFSTKNSRQFTLTGPYELIQGGEGAIGRLPVYMYDNNKDEYFWGFICVTIDFPEVFDPAQMSHLTFHNYNYEVWKIRPEDGSRQTILQSPQPVARGCRDAAITLPNATWMLSVSPIGGWVNANVMFMRAGVAFTLSILLSLVFYYTCELFLKKKELDYTILQQAANYEQMNQLNKELREFRHDVNNHMLSISDLLANRDFDAAKEYASSIAHTLADSQRLINTENYVFDAIISQKSQAAQQKGIRVETEISIPGHLKISNTDWSTLFGNALDNAIEACEKEQDKTASIWIWVRYMGDMLHVKISNTSSQEPLYGERRLITTKKDMFLHGIGMRNMDTVVKKYHGVLETRYEDGIFSLSFVLLNV